MAAALQHQSSLERNEAKTTLEIKTKSVEQTLIPLVTQVSTLDVSLLYYFDAFMSLMNIDYFCQWLTFLSLSASFSCTFVL